MGRKVAQIGPSTLMISLPSKWARQYNIKKGDELNVIEKENALLITNSEKAKPLEKTTIDLSNVNTSVAWYYLTAAYRSGAEEITIFFNKPTINDETQKKAIDMHEFIKLVSNRCIGMEIIRNTQESCILKEISSIKEGEFPTMLRRVFFSLTNTFNDILTSIQQKDKKMLHHIFLHSDTTVNKFTNYCMRIISQTANTQQSTCAIITHLEEIGDALKYLANQLATQPTKQEKDNITSLKKLFTLAEKFYYTSSKEALVAFEQQKRKIRKDLSTLTKNNNPSILLILTNILNQSVALVNARLMQNR